MIGRQTVIALDDRIDADHPAAVIAHRAVLANDHGLPLLVDLVDRDTRFVGLIPFPALLAFAAWAVEVLFMLGAIWAGGFDGRALVTFRTYVTPTGEMEKWSRSRRRSRPGVRRGVNPYPCTTR